MIKFLRRNSIFNARKLSIWLLDVRRNVPRWAPVLWLGRSGDVTMMLQAAIEITCHDHSTTVWAGRSYILLRYLVFVFVVRFLFIR